MCVSCFHSRLIDTSAANIFFYYQPLFWQYSLFLTVYDTHLALSKADDLLMTAIFFPFNLKYSKATEVLKSIELQLSGNKWEWFCHNFFVSAYTERWYGAFENWNFIASSDSFVEHNNKIYKHIVLWDMKLFWMVWRSLHFITNKK